MRTALFDGDQPALHYQPKINASDGSIHSVEALVRWHHPSRGLLLPEEFLPAAERAGVMRKLADRTLELALMQIQSWREQRIVSSVAVNLSTTNLLDPELVGTIKRLLRTYGLPADALIVEIRKVPSLTRCGPVIPLPSCGASAFGSPLTTTAPAGLRWHACRMSRSTS